MTTDFMTLLRAVYLKTSIENVYVDDGAMIALIRALLKQKDNLPCLKNVIKYLFYIDSNHIFKLLYMGIPKKNYIPKNFKTEKKEIKINKELAEIKEYFNWSERELKFYKPILDFTLKTAKSEIEEEPKKVRKTKKKKE